MDITKTIRLHWYTHLINVFGDDYMFVGQNLPVFRAYQINGKIRAFIGKVTENEADVVRRAIELYQAQGLQDAA